MVGTARGTAACRTAAEWACTTGRRKWTICPRYWGWIVWALTTGRRYCRITVPGRKDTDHCIKQRQCPHLPYIGVGREQRVLWGRCQAGHTVVLGATSPLAAGWQHVSAPIYPVSLASHPQALCTSLSLSVQPAWPQAPSSQTTCPLASHWLVYWLSSFLPTQQY